MAAAASLPRSLGTLQRPAERQQSATFGRAPGASALLTPAASARAAESPSGFAASLDVEGLVASIDAAAMKAVAAAAGGGSAPERSVSLAPAPLAVTAPPPVVPFATSTFSERQPAQDALYDYSQRLGTRVQAMEVELAQLREERDALKAENKVLGNHVFGLQQENGMLRDMGWSSFLEKTQLVKQGESMSDEATQLQVLVQRQQQQIEALTAEKLAAQRAADALQNDRSQLQHSIKGLEANLEVVQKDLTARIARETSLAERCVEREQQLESLGAERRRLDDIVTGQAVEAAQLKQASQELLRERARSHHFGQQLQTAEMEIARLGNEKTRADELITTLRVELAQTSTQRDSAKAEVPALQGSVQQHAAAVADYHEQVVQLRQAVHELSREKATMEQESRSLQVALDAARREAAHGQAAASALHAEKGQLKSALDGVSGKKVEVDERLLHALGDRGRLQAHMEALQAENSQLQLKVQQVGAEGGVTHSRLLGYEKMVKGFQDENAGLQQRVQSLTEERDELQSRLDEFVQPLRGSHGSIRGAL